MQNNDSNTKKVPFQQHKLKALMQLISVCNSFTNKQAHKKIELRAKYALSLGTTHQLKIEKKGNCNQYHSAKKFSTRSTPT